MSRTAGGGTSRKGLKGSKGKEGGSHKERTGKRDRQREKGEGGGDNSTAKYR